MSLAEALEAYGWKPPRAPAGGHAIVRGHCHQKALIGMRAGLELLSAAGTQADAPDMGCCGMAGSFGFRPETYEASVRIAGLSLLPKFRDTAPETLIVSNGFSCREQIEGLSGPGTLHLAEVLVAHCAGASYAVGGRAASGVGDLSLLAAPGAIATCLRHEAPAQP